MEKKKQLKMYVLVPSSLSGIACGIQSAHAIVEYGLNNIILPNELKNKVKLKKDDKYIEWASTHKTIIILNAGTTGPTSTMESHRKALDKLGVHYSFFIEPDLNNAMTAIAFIVDMKEDSHIVGYLKQMKLA